MFCFDIKRLFLLRKYLYKCTQYVHFTSFIYLCDHLVFLWYGLGFHKQHPKSQHCYHLWEISVIWLMITRSVTITQYPIGFLVQGLPAI